MTQSPRILILGSYPCVVPRHGGQIRLAEIIANYRRAGFQVQSMNLYTMTATEARGPHDFNYPWNTPWREWNGRQIPLIDDYTAGLYAAGDATIYARLTEAVEGEPDVIEFEHPWLLPLVERWRAEGRFPRALIVYGSHNIEAPLERAILEQYGIAEAAAVAVDIDALERRACAVADIVFAVSENDRQQLATYGRAEALLAANGISAWQATPTALEHWRAQLPACPFPLFIGSGHPPNISGFFAAIGDSLGFLAPDNRFCVVGGVSEHIAGHPRLQRWGPLNQSRLQVLGMVDDDALAAIKTLAHVFVLPITEGGGSNIKTAEALYSGKHVVGTPTSFRGFDAWLDLPGVHCVEPGPAFARKIQELLAQPLPQDSAQDAARRAALLWSHTLAPMPATLKRYLTRASELSSHTS